MWVSLLRSVYPVPFELIHRAGQVPYPLISLVTRLPQTLAGKNPLAIRMRTFENIVLSFEKDTEASDVFESVKELTVASESSTPPWKETDRFKSSRLRNPAICFRIRPQSTFTHQKRVVDILPTRGIRANGNRISDQSLAVYGHQQGILGKYPAALA